MARRSPINPDNEMENRDATEEEIAAIVGTGPDAFVPVITAPMDPSRDDDFEDSRSAAPEAPAGFDFARMTAALEAIEKRNADGGGSNDVLALALAQLATAIGGMKEGMLQGAQLQADMQRRTTAPENRVFPNISAFNLRGDKDFPRPTLKCPMRFPGFSDVEALTREEIELLNLLEQGEYYIVRTDRSKVKVQVLVEKKLNSDEPSLIRVVHPTAFNNDNHKQMPFDWIRQIVTQNPKTAAAARAVLTMEEEAALIAARKFNDGRVAESHERLVSVGE